MFRYPLLVLFSTVLVYSCKNTPPDQAGQTGAAQPGKPVDTTYGFEGSDRAAMTVVSGDTVEFQYQKYIVRTYPNIGELGEVILLSYRDSTMMPYPLPVTADGYFHGISHDHAIIERGTSPDIREFLVFDLRTNKPRYQTQYVDTVSISADGKIWFYQLADSTVFENLPPCPQEAAWRANNLTVGYGRRCIYNLVNGSLTQKSELKCIPLQ
jgi:hypothetical protein